MTGLKVKSKSSKPRPLIKYDIQITSEVYKNNSKIELCIDVVYINGILFLVYGRMQNSLKKTNF